MGIHSQISQSQGFAAHLKALASIHRKKRDAVRKTNLVFRRDPGLVTSPQPSDIVQERLDTQNTYFTPLDHTDFVSQLSDQKLHVFGTFKEAQGIYDLALQLSVVMTDMAYYQLPAMMHTAYTARMRGRLSGAIADYGEVLMDMAEKLHQCADVMCCFGESKPRKYEEVEQIMIPEKGMCHSVQDGGKVSEMQRRISVFDSSFHRSVFLMNELLYSFDDLSYRISEGDHAMTVTVRACYRELFATLIDQPLAKAKDYLEIVFNVICKMMLGLYCACLADDNESAE